MSEQPRDATDARVLLVSDHYPPYVGGVQRQTKLLAEHFLSAGHEVGVVTVWQPHLPSFTDEDGFPVWRIRQLRSLIRRRKPGIRFHQPPFPDPVSVVGLRRVLREFEPDVVNASGWFSYTAAAALLGSSVPLILSIREYGFICANGSLLHRGEPCSGPAPWKCLDCAVWYFDIARGPSALAGVWLSKPLLARKAAVVHSVSRYVEEVVTPHLRRKRQEAERIVLPSFNLGDEETADPTLLPIFPDEPFILFVGALRRVKGIGTLLDAYDQLTSKPPLVLLGTFEEDTPPLPEGVYAPGGLAHAGVLAAWDRALFGVMPSLWPEPFGSVIHEAMSRGRAVIGTTPGGHEDMIEDGVNGLLVPPGDARKLAAAMQRLIDDPTYRETLAGNAKSRARTFEASAVMPKWEALIFSVTAASS